MRLFQNLQRLAVVVVVVVVDILLSLSCVTEKPKEALTGTDITRYILMPRTGLLQKDLAKRSILSDFDSTYKVVVVVAGCHGGLSEEVLVSERISLIQD